MARISVKPRRRVGDPVSLRATRPPTWAGVREDGLQDGLPPRTLTQESLVRMARSLAERDEDLARILVRLGPPPLWSRRPGFPTLLRIILEQQVSLASARAVFQRLSGAVRPLTAWRAIELGESYLRSLGLTRQKAAYCLSAACSLAQKQLDLAAVARMEDSAAKAALMRVKGIGSWTADIYLLMALRRVDVWPSGDLALLAAIRRLKAMAEPLTPAAAAAIADGWRPCRSVAARMLWQYYLAERDGRRRRQVEEGQPLR